MFLSKIKNIGFKRRENSQVFYFVLGARGYVSALDNGRWTDTQGRKHAIIILSKLEHTQVPRSFRKTNSPFLSFFRLRASKMGDILAERFKHSYFFERALQKWGGVFCGTLTF